MTRAAAVGWVRHPAELSPVEPVMYSLWAYCSHTLCLPPEPATGDDYNQQGQNKLRRIS